MADQQDGVTKGAARAHQRWARRARAHPRMNAALAAGHCRESIRGPADLRLDRQAPAGLPGRRRRDPGRRRAVRRQPGGPGPAGRGDLRPVPAAGPRRAGRRVRGPVGPAGDHLRGRRGPGRGPDPGVRGGGRRGAGRPVGPRRGRGPADPRAAVPRRACRRDAAPPGGRAAPRSGPGSPSAPGRTCPWPSCSPWTATAALLGQWVTAVRARWAGHRAAASRRRQRRRPPGWTGPRPPRWRATPWSARSSRARWTRARWTGWSGSAWNWPGSAPARPGRPGRGRTRAATRTARPAGRHHRRAGVPAPARRSSAPSSARPSNCCPARAACASFLRRQQLGAPLAGPSLPLDIGYSNTVPAAIRHAVTLRDAHCRWPGGCTQPAAACQVHHVRHKANGGPTSVNGLHTPVLLPPPGRHPPLGLDPGPEPRRHHHGLQPRWRQGPAQSQPTRPLTNPRDRARTGVGGVTGWVIGR